MEVEELGEEIERIVLESEDEGKHSPRASFFTILLSYCTFRRRSGIETKNEGIKAEIIWEIRVI